MIYLNIPSPKDLGMSNRHNSMAIDGMLNYPGEPSWEDYYARCKREFPVRYFFASTVPMFFRNIWWNISRKPKALVYWLKCHLIPSHRYHLIDIRQKPDPRNPMSGYSHGWMDSDHRMVLAMFALLVDFIENEAPTGYFVPTEEDVAKDESYAPQRANWLELKAIYDYWVNERHELEAKCDKALMEWSKARRSLGREDAEVKRLYSALEESEKMRDSRLEEMLLRLVKARKAMWT
jgi:hypothetical protein